MKANITYIFTIIATILYNKKYNLSIFKIIINLTYNK